MDDPAAFFALLALFASLGAVAFTSRSVTRLAEQYTEFVQTHIGGLRIEIHKKGKEQVKAINALLQELADVSKVNKQLQQDLAEHKLAVAELRSRIDRSEQENGAKTVPRRGSKSAVLRAISQ